MSFKQRKCRCVTQIDRQGVPERRCRKTERAVTNSLHVSFGDSKQFFARSTKSAGGIVGAKCIGQIGWESSIKVAVFRMNDTPSSCAEQEQQMHIQCGCF